MYPLKNITTKFCIILLFGFLIVFKLTGTDISNDNYRFYSPVIPGYNADPSSCRVGSDYYTITSTSEYFPGIPVYHSRDLVSWKMIGHVLSRPSQLTLDSVECARGVFAPTIRYHRGTFYVICTLTGVAKGNPSGNFIVTSKNPAGPWSEPVWLPDVPGIDPSLFFDDDGKVYIHGNFTPSTRLFDKHRDIWQAELDMATNRLVSKPETILNTSDFHNRELIDRGVQNGLNNFEAPHIYKKDNWYYLVIAHGGTFHNHAISIFRSRQIQGPYENNPLNPILTHRNLSLEAPITSTGHADFIETPDGKWWMVYLARRPYGGDIHILGRETFLASINWKDGWPIVNPHGNTGKFNLESTNSTDSDHPDKHIVTIRDEFSDSQLAPDWTFLRTPHEPWWSLISNKGYLTMQLRSEKVSEIQNPSFIGRRLQTENAYFCAKMEYKPVTHNEEAGLVVIRDRKNYLKFTVSLEKEKRVVKVHKRSLPNATDLQLAALEDSEDKLLLRIDSKGVLFSFSVSSDGTEWHNVLSDVDARFLGMPEAGRFTGTFIGMYAFAANPSATKAVLFDWIETTSF